jgi:hypothetical protein
LQSPHFSPKQASPLAKSFPARQVFTGFRINTWKIGLDRTVLIELSSAIGVSVNSITGGSMKDVGVIFSAGVSSRHAGMNKIMIRVNKRILFFPFIFKLRVVQKDMYTYYIRIMASI